MGIVLRGDLPRLHRCAHITTASSTSPIKRSKPLKYAYEKEIVLYAHHKKLDYFSTECIYSPEAFRGSARALIKNLEKIRPSSILDVVKSGEAFAAMTGDIGPPAPEEEGEGGCGSVRSGGGSMEAEERRLRNKEKVAKKGKANQKGAKKRNEQKLGSCIRCGYLTSQELCKACVLLDGLNKTVPRVEVELEGVENIVKGVEKVDLHIDEIKRAAAAI